MEQTEAGLVVPDGTIRLNRDVLVKEDWHQIQRSIKTLDALGIHVIFVCALCAQRPATEGAKITQSYFRQGKNSQDGSTMMKCNCRVVVTNV